MSDHFPCHTAYHSNFFVLRLDVRFNGQPVKLNFTSDRQLELCGQPAESVALSMVGQVIYFSVFSTTYIGTP